MKTIRFGTFETNSSSTHAIAVSKNNDYDSVNKIKFIKGIEFGWDYNLYSNPDEKFTYLLIAMSTLKYNDFKKGTEMITEALKECGVKSIIYPEIQMKEHKGDNEESTVVLNDEELENSYIDHGQDFVWRFYRRGYYSNDNDRAFLDILADKQLIKNFILGDSWITTGNDNADGYWLPVNDKSDAYGFYDDYPQDDEDKYFMKIYDELSKDYYIYFKSN